MTLLSVPTQLLTPRQIRTLDQLLSIGMDRPFSTSEIADDLSARIELGTRQAIQKWTSGSLYVTKSQVLTAARCEGQLVADAFTSKSGMSAPIAVGVSAHRAVQLSYTHPGRPVNDYVKQSVIGARAADENLDAWWAAAGTSVQSDILMQITSKVVNFIDDWPPLDPTWSPRFEEPIVAKIGRLSLSARADLIIGRPRSDLRRSLLLVDLKTSGLKDQHRDEALFYALIATLRYGVMPWRSTVYSLASGDWTDPEISIDDLFSTADSVISAVNSIVDTLTESRLAVLTPGDHCRWCPVRESCAVGPNSIKISSPVTV
jgi:hypothetical protein